jgi:Secretion system C-terminal sorting domain
MKIYRKLFLSFLLLLISKNIFAFTTVTNTITNFEVLNNSTEFQFDIYTVRTSFPDFYMGSSSYYMRYNIGNFTKSIISNVNPRYTVIPLNSGTGSYDAMQVFTYDQSGRVGVQIFYNGNGGGDTISGDPGIFGLGERIATVTMQILNYSPPNLRWDNANTAVVNPQFETAVSTNVGAYNGILPVEMTNFVSIILGNKVTLNWSTATESNNKGFDIERKKSGGSWDKVGFVNGKGNSNEIINYSFADNSLQTGTYNYRLKQIDFNGNFEYHVLNNSVEIGIPDKFELSQNYPNPFNPSTKINFSIPYDSRVSLKVYDISGKLISTLINNEFREADYYTLEFNANGLSSGVYFYAINTDKNTATKKMTLIK